MKNKILTISIVFILTSFILISNVFAYGDSFEYEGTSITTYIPDAPYNTLFELPYYDNPDYKYIAYCGDSRLNVYFFPKDMDIKIWKKTLNINDGAFYSNSNTISNFTCIRYFIRESDGSIISENQNETSFATETRTLGYYIGNNFHYFITNMNIYTDSTCTDFFFEAPVTVTGTLAPILEGVEMKEPMMREILTLVPIMIILIVSYLGLRKGLTLLKTLRKM